jgi:hypothetical protein
MKTIVHTLGYNIPDLIEEATVSLKRKNKNFDYTHVIADLGYPLKNGRDHWHIIPADTNIEEAYNLHLNHKIALGLESDLVKFNNHGVSGNWTTIANLYGIGDGDVLIGADPDERPMDENWVKAIAEVMDADKNIAIVSLALPELLALEGFFENYFIGERILNGHRVWYGKFMCQWALIGISGRFIAKAGRVPSPEIAPIYGWIETACLEFMNHFGMDWVMLPDYRVQHIASSPLAQEWKNEVVTADAMNAGQVDFKTWLKSR